MRGTPWHGAVFFMLAVAAALGGCSGGGGTPASSGSHTTPLPSATPSPQPTPTPGGITGNFTEPPVVQSTGGSLSIALAALQNPSNGFPEWSWNGANVPPTLEVSPGDAMHVAYSDQLVAGANGFPGETNLHFHGFSSSPLVPGDDVLDTLLSPGGSTDYTVLVNPDQPPGVYWYHTHPHGETTWQNDNGMNGAIVVDGIQDEVPAVAGLRTRLLVVRDISKDPSSIRRRLVRLCGLAHLTPAERERLVRAQERLSPQGAEGPGVLTVNGQIASSNIRVGIGPGERELVRVVNATSRRTLDLAADGESLQLVSRDGVPLVDFAGSPSSLTVADQVLPPGGRAEFIITGQSSPFGLHSLAYDSGPAGDPDPAGYLALFFNDGGGTGAGRLPRSRHRRIAPLLYRRPLPAPAAYHTIVFTENASGTIFYLNGQTFNPNAPPAVVSRAGTVEQWTLEDATDEVHDFHIHQAHFVVDSVNGVPVPASQRHWLDTFNIPPQTHNPDGTTTPGTVVVTIDFRDPAIRGTFVYHCHILDHEDAGMMAKIQVI